jgi:Domain of unknown function (DUF929)
VGRESNKRRRERQAATAREKAAAARLSRQKAEQRRRALMVLSGAVVLFLIVGAAVAIGVTHKGSNASDRVAAPTSVVNAVTNVSDATLTTVGKGSVLAMPAAVSDETPLTANGKPELLYIGAEFCPYCAVERWSLAEALSEFGTFTNLGMVHSAADDGNYASLDFYKASYTSPYLTFTSVENRDRANKSLEKLSAAQNALWVKLSPANDVGYPFIDFGNTSAIAGKAPLDPAVLGSLSQAQIAGQLNDPSSKVAQTISGGANDDIAAICQMTGNKPANVCSSSTITSLESQISA